MGTSFFDWVHIEDKKIVKRALAQVIGRSDGRGGTRTVECRLAHEAFGWRHSEVTVTSLLHDPGIRGLVINARGVTEHVMLERKLRRQALHDGLTHLANRSLFKDRVEHALSRTQRHGTTIAVLFIDLDDFKTINDSLGHAAGDRLLAGVATRLTESLRPEDTAARLGGDEFAVLIEDLDAREAASRVAERPARAGLAGDDSAHQGLGPRHAAAGQVVDRLVMQHELFSLERSLELSRCLEPGQSGDVHARQEE